MPTHVREAVVAAVQTSLEQIGIGPGVNWALAVPPLVERFRGVEELAQQFPVIFMAIAGEQKSRQGSTGNRTHYNSDLTMSLECWVEGTDLDTELSKVVHDVESALGADWTQGGTCIDTEITGNTTAYSETEETRAVVFVSVRFQYRHLDSTPSVQT